MVSDYNHISVSLTISYIITSLHKDYLYTFNIQKLLSNIT